MAGRHPGPVRGHGRRARRRHVRRRGEPANVRPIPRRPGRGIYDPEAAERARAYKFARRRRAVLVLTLLIVGFALAAVLVSSTLWIGAGVSAVLLALFLTYLRRQVRIEADIRDRRLAKLQRARQIRPDTSRTPTTPIRMLSGPQVRSPTCRPPVRAAGVRTASSWISTTTIQASTTWSSTSRWSTAAPLDSEVR